MAVPEGVQFVPPDELRRLVQRVVVDSKSSASDLSPTPSPTNGTKTYPPSPSNNGAAKFTPLVQGASVEYWSESFNRWVEARVKMIHDDGTLDLDVKRGANPAKVRPRRDEEDAGSVSPARASPERDVLPTSNGYPEPP